MRFFGFIFHNFWLKIISLVLAVATWFYVFDLVNSDSNLPKKSPLEEIFLRYEYSMKDVPVKVVFKGKSPQGYRVLYDEVKVEPSSIYIFAPHKALGYVEEIRTEPIDLAEYTRTSRVLTGLKSDVSFLRFKEKAVTVYIPVELQGKKAEKTEEIK